MLRVGIVGCGEVAQIIHLPTLRELRDRIVVTAACDVSPRVLATVADQWRIEHRFADHRELVRSPAVDAVLVTNPHLFHAEVAIAAMQAGKHVLIEKPMCVTLAEADRLAAAQDASGVVAQVGYMRRYAPAFTEAVKLVRAMSEVSLARVHDVPGLNALIIAQTSDVIRPTDLTEAQGEALRAGTAARVAEAVGPAPAAIHGAYARLLGLGSHDLSAMRELLGQPRRVLHASARGEGGRNITAAFDYGDFVCLFSTGAAAVPRFDAHIEVHSPARTVRVDYDTPYVRNLPTRLTVTDAAPNGMARTETSFSWRCSFLIEWLAFHDSITTGTPPKTGIADARQDLTLFGQMVEAMRASGD